ncbi:MAG: hypothetical protein WDZ35_12615 [Crocinitomicaceae bacterium]
MGSTNWTTTQLKLKRHNLNYEFNPQLNSLKLGGINTTRYQLIYVFLPTAIGMAILSLIFTGIFSDGSNLKMWLGTGACFLAAIYGIYTVSRMKNSNKDIKIFHPDKIILDGENYTEIPANKIKSIESRVSKTKQEFHGEVVLSTKDNKEYVLLGLIDDDSRLISDDLEYFSDYLTSLLNGGKENEC